MKPFRGRKLPFIGYLLCTKHCVRCCFIETKLCRRFAFCLPQELVFSLELIEMLRITDMLIWCIRFHSSQ